MSHQYKKIDPVYKKKWVEALCSGEYEQGTGRLCNAGKEYDYFCCLGVLCDVIDPKQWKYQDGLVCFGEEATSVPPTKIIKKVGLDTSAIDHLVFMNDTKRKTFKQIANWIDKYL